VPGNGKVSLKKVIEVAVTVFDVRPVEEYQAGHIPGALSVPLNKLKKLLYALPQDQENWINCRGQANECSGYGKLWAGS